MDRAEKHPRVFTPSLSSSVSAFTGHQDRCLSIRYRLEESVLPILDTIVIVVSVVVVVDAILFIVELKIGNEVTVCEDSILQLFA